MTQALTQKQKNQLALAKPEDKKALTAKFHRDNQVKKPKANAEPRPPAKGKGKGSGQQNGQTNGARRNSVYVPPKEVSIVPHYYDAFNNECERVTLATSVGPATPVFGTSVETVVGTERFEGDYYLDNPLGGLAVHKQLKSNIRLLIFNPGSSDEYCGVVIGLEEIAVPPGTTSPTTPTIGAKIINTLRLKQFVGQLGPAKQSSYVVSEDYDDDSAHKEVKPTNRVESIPLRGSIRVKNVSENFTVGGTVRVLRYSGSVRYWDDPAGGKGIKDSTKSVQEPDLDAVLNLCEMIRTSDASRDYSGKELQLNHQINTHPADFIRSSMFRDDETFSEALMKPRFTTVLMLFEDFVSSTGTANIGNQYEVRTHVHRAGRFEPGSLLHAKKQELNGAPAKSASVAAAESSNGSHLTPTHTLPGEGNH